MLQFQNRALKTDCYCQMVRPGFEPSVKFHQTETFEGRSTVWATAPRQTFLYSDRTNLLKANRNHNGWRKLTTLTRWCGCIIVVVAAERKKRSASLTWRQLTNLKPQLIAALEKMFATGAWRGLQCCTAPALLWFRQSPRASVHATTFANQRCFFFFCHRHRHSLEVTK